MKIYNKILVGAIITSLIIPFPVDLYNNKEVNKEITKTSCNKLTRILNNYIAYAIDEPVITKPSEPIVFNLGGSGEYATSIEKGRYFDFNNDGLAEKMAWASEGYGVLAADLNRNGMIDSGEEIITDENFSSFDSNNDGIINKEDKDYDILRIVRRDGSITTLEEEKIAYINTNRDAADYTDVNGNYNFGSGTFNRTDGSISNFKEYYFVADTRDAIELNKQPETKTVKALPDIKNQGTLHSLHQAMLKDKTLENLVSQFVKETNKETRAELLSQILLRWTNSDNLDASAQHIAVADSILGLRNPVANEEITTSDEINVLKEQLYAQFENYVYSELMRQSHYKNIISLIKFKDNKYDLTALVKYLDKQNKTDKDTIADIARVIKGLGIDKQSNFFDPKNDDCFYTKFIANNRDLKWEVDTIAKTPMDTKNPVIKPVEYDLSRGLGLNGTNLDDTYNAMLDKVNKEYAFVHSFGGDDVIFGDNGRSVIYTCHGSDMLDGGDANDMLFGVFDDDIIYGRGGNDTIYGGAGNDVIIGGAGNDEIYTNQFDERRMIIEYNTILGRNVGGGDNIVNGGKGNDTIYSAAGNDTYIFNRGDGEDVIYKEGGFGTISFGKDIAWNDLVFNRLDDHMVISLKNSKDSIIVTNWFNPYYNEEISRNAKISLFEFADGTRHYENEIKVQG